MILLTMESVLLFLEQELERRGWKQADLARNANMDTGMVSNIMSGKRNIGPATAVSIAQALKIAPEILFRKAGLLPPAPVSTAQTDQLFFLFNQLDDKRKKDLIDMAAFWAEKG